MMIKQLNRHIINKVKYKNVKEKYNREGDDKKKITDKMEMRQNNDN